MARRTAGGTEVYIGPEAAATLDTLTEYEAISWVEVGGVESVGEFGDESNISTFTALKDNRVEKIKAARDAGNVPLVVGHEPLDAGQQALDAAEQTPFEYPIKVVLPDHPTSGSEKTNIYFRALVTSRRFNVGDNANVMRRNFNLAINSPLVVDLATPT